MNQIILFAVLGIGTGAAYALTALGIVLTYRGSGVVNFAQGAIMMLAAFSYADLSQHGMPRVLAIAIVLVGGAVVGALIYLLVMRPLRWKPQLAKVIATIGLLVGMEGIAQLGWGTVSGELSAPELIPSTSISLFGVAFSVDRIWLLGITAVLVVILWATYRFTRFGLATRATAENERGAAFLGFSPDAVAITNWALGSLLAAVAGVLLAPVTTLDVDTLTFLVLPAIAAAMIGRFSSFTITALVGLAIGIGQSELTRYWNVRGAFVALPLVVVIVAMILRGRLIPPRGTLADVRPPFAMSGAVKPLWLLTMPIVAIALLAVLTSRYQAALTTSMIVATIALSMTVVTGYVGQVSLAPMTFAGFGGFAVSKFGENLGIPFPLPILLGGLVAIPVGVLIGAPALRVRGINLAVVTLGAAIAIDAVAFQNQSLTGGQTGSLVPSPRLGSFSLDPIRHPTRFGIFALICLGLLMLAVSMLRRNPLGRRMLAVRGNERAAAVAGINVPALKLQAFAISAAIAAIGGGVLAYQLSAVSYTEFVPLESLTLVTLAYIGGIASVSGALQAGLLTSGGVFYVLLSQVGALDRYWALLTGVLLVLTIVTQPDGIAVANSQLLRAVVGRLRRSTVAAEEPPPRTVARRAA
jgi:ABC-type branched-subunit amino acid transport system permease subunit